MSNDLKIVFFLTGWAANVRSLAFTGNFFVLFCKLQKWAQISDRNLNPDKDGSGLLKMFSLQRAMAVQATISASHSNWNPSGCKIRQIWEPNFTFTMPYTRRCSFYCTYIVGQFDSLAKAFLNYASYSRKNSNF
jgi:hypothetical protein